MTIPVKKDFDSVDTQFEFIREPNGDLKMFDGDEPEYQKADYHHCWTLVDGEGTRAHIVAGHRRVNRLAHYLSKKPVSQEMLDSWFTVDEEE